MTSAESVIAKLRAGIVGSIVKFGIVGLLGFVVDVGIFNLLRLGVGGAEGWWTTALGAKVVSTSVAIVFNWIGNRYWTFRADRHTHVVREFIEFIVASLAGMVVALGCLWFSHHVLGLVDIVSDNISGNVIGLGLGTLLRFLLYRYWVFNPNRAKPVVVAAASPEVSTTEPFAAKRTLVLIPTYNELENLPIVVANVRAAAPTADILIIDDGSPDGTGALADTMVAADAQVHVMHRREKNGLGDAYIAGFTWGLEAGYEILVEMDADGSHPSESLADLIATVTPANGASLDETPGLAIGSRWTNGGSVVNWPLHRLVLSRGGNTYAGFMLGLGVHDATAGFRAFRADVLEAIRFTDVDSHGYCFQIDMTLRVSDAGFTIVEVPIEFRERTLGESKMSQAIVMEAMSKVSVWGVQRRWRKLTGRPVSELKAVARAKVYH